jgi:hypothetical protein
MLFRYIPSNSTEALQGANLDSKVTGRGGLQGCEMPRIPHFLDSRLKDGG